jgi:hypothetical protein
MFTLKKEILKKKESPLIIKDNDIIFGGECREKMSRKD